MRIIVLGADGYLGWPTCLHLEHEIIAVDNYLKRELLASHNISPLHNVPSLKERVLYSGKSIRVIEGDLSDYEFTKRLLLWKPDAIIDYAEIPSAPYSMISHNTAKHTIENNIRGTLNLIYAIKENSPNTHLIKLGTMGEYGTPNIDIEEGYIDINHNGRTETTLYPKKPGSMYHLSKVYDSDALYFACRTWGLRVTDLNQGFVYGLHEKDPKLSTRFCYDHMFGTALNRFIVQAVSGHDITIYGKGNQTRGVLNIKDTLECVRLACEYPAKEGEFRVLNQFTEQFSINSLAEKVVNVAKELGYRCDLNHIENPRKEEEEHYYNAKADKLKELGLKPTLLDFDVLAEMIGYVSNYRNDLNKNQILPKIKWA